MYKTRINPTLMSFIIKDLSRGLVLMFIYNLFYKGNLVKSELFYAK